MAQEESFATQAYWDKKYQSKDTLFDWLDNYENIRPIINSLVPKNHRILAPGCGNSTMSADMIKDGYEKIDNIDFSPVCIEQMKKRYNNIQQLTWDVMDIKHMSFPDSTFDSILDKGTLDALTCGENYEDDIRQALNEYTRVLKPDCKAVIISFGQAPERIGYMDPKSPHPWVYEGFQLLPKEFAPHSFFHAYIIRKPK